MNSIDAFCSAMSTPFVVVSDGMPKSASAVESNGMATVARLLSVNSPGPQLEFDRLIIRPVASVGTP